MGFNSKRVVKREPYGNLIDYVWKQKMSCAHVCVKTNYISYARETHRIYLYKLFLCIPLSLIVKENYTDTAYSLQRHEFSFVRSSCFFDRKVKIYEINRKRLQNGVANFQSYQMYKLNLCTSLSLYVVEKYTGSTYTFETFGDFGHF